MSISLFPHNQTAYESLLTVLETEQRACIIHPTGTGKSFIGFKCCEKHPTQAVLWLSPSAYIFKTQCESLLVAGVQVPENISYMTYSKLSQLDPAELNELRPNVIILDEMHRAAAPTSGHMDQSTACELEKRQAPGGAEEAPGRPWHDLGKRRYQTQGGARCRRESRSWSPATGRTRCRTSPATCR